MIKLRKNKGKGRKIKCYNIINGRIYLFDN